ncbi:MAG: tetratricopeptide repeat protein, partial [Candidatus Melainabacteria bacterium]|nr:tetratricopeptide repeat protein [Candidatus Melainabacteria bacterium]
SLVANDPLIIESLSNLVSVYRQRDYRLSDGTPFFERLLQCRKASIASDHLVLAQTHTAFGEYLKSKGKYAKAEPHYKQALEITQRSIGANHRDTATAAHALAMVLRGQGKHTEAEPFFLRALDIRTQVFGSDSLPTSETMAELARAYTSQRRYTEAEELLKQAILIQSKRPANNEARLRVNYKDLADLYLRRGLVTEALALYDQSAWIEHRLLGYERPQPKKLDTPERIVAAGNRQVNDTLNDNANPYFNAFQLVNVAPLGSLEFVNARQVLTGKYSWAVPTEAALKAIVDCGDIVEVGAGTGYWAALLRQRGGSIVAYDSHPVPSSGNKWHWGASKGWTEILPGNEAVAKDYPNHTLMLCWPPCGQPMAYNALKAFTGSRLIYIGEGPDGITGNAAFHELLAKDWRLERTIKIPTWREQSDAVYIYRRRT